MSVKRPLGRKGENFTKWHLGFVPLEDQCTLWSENPKTLSKALAEHFPPVTSKRAILFQEPARIATPLDVRRVKHDMGER